MTDLWNLRANDLAKAIKEQEVSCVEVIDAHLARIEAVNPKVNALTLVLAEQARLDAKAADAALAARGEVGPLHGVPVTIKENIDVAGTPTTHGAVTMAGAVAAQDAPLVEHLRDAGAIIIGRTNMPDFALRWHTDSSAHGATLNPWDGQQTPGGSSGGEAVALATGMTALGIGNDLGGSLRWPSQCNGTAALKPTTGRIAQATVVEPVDPPLSLQLFNAQGPMARCVSDLRVPFAVMTRPSSRDPWHVPLPVVPAETNRPCRVAVVTNPTGEGIDPTVAADVRQAADALADAGYDVVEIEPPRITEALETWKALLIHDVRQLWPFLSEIVGPDTRAQFDLALETQPVMDGPTAAGTWMTRNAIARSWAEFFADHPLILSPIATCRPFEASWETLREHMLELLPSLRMVVPINLLGLPSVAVPMGAAEHRPGAVQVIGRWFHEHECLDAGEVIEATQDAATPIDPAPR